MTYFVIFLDTLHTDFRKVIYNNENPVLCYVKADTLEEADFIMRLINTLSKMGIMPYRHIRITTIKPVNAEYLEGLEKKLKKIMRILRGDEE